MQRTFGGALLLWFSFSFVMMMLISIIKMCRSDDGGISTNHYRDTFNISGLLDVTNYAFQELYVIDNSSYPNTISLSVSFRVNPFEYFLVYVPLYFCLAIDKLSFILQ